jgi:hypothetical protein
MLPTEQFSGDAVPQVPWQPQAWSKSAQQLVQEAQKTLFDNNGAIDASLNGTDDSDTMSGAGLSPTNDGEMIIDASTPGDSPGGSGGTGGRASQWHSMLNDLRDPLPRAERTPSRPWSPMAESPNPPA